MGGARILLRVCPSPATSPSWWGAGSCCQATEASEKLPSAAAEGCRAMSIPFSNTRQRVPRGFANLLEGLAREVLREQPADIAAFAAQHFEELLDKRDKSRLDPAEWGAKLEDRFYNNKAFEEAATLKEEVRESMRDPAIESELDTCGLYQTSTHEIEDKAATKIQAAYRGYRVRETVRRMKELARDAANPKEES